MSGGIKSRIRQQVISALKAEWPSDGFMDSVVAAVFIFNVTGTVLYRFKREDRKILSYNFKSDPSPIGNRLSKFAEVLGAHPGWELNISCHTHKGKVHNIIINLPQEGLI